METKQLEIFKVIEFPKNKEMENDLKYEKLEIAIKMLKFLVDEGADFHIILNRKDTLKLFEYSNNIRDYLILTSNLEIAKNLEINNKIPNLYELIGNEFD